jgi:hypothetical protein
MESDDLFPQAIDTLLGGADEDGHAANAAPGFGARDFRQLGRMLFWPALLSVMLACWAVMQGLAAS